MSQVTVEELEIIIKAKIDSEVRKIGAILAAQFKSAEAAMQPLQQKVQALSAAMSKVGQNAGEPAKKSFDQMQSVIDRAQAKSEQASAKSMQQMNQQAAKEEAVQLKRAESMQRAADAIVARERSICEAVERTISKMQGQAKAAQLLTSPSEAGPVKSYKMASQILPDESKPNAALQAQAAVVQKAGMLVTESIDRINQAFSGMEEAAQQASGGVAAGLANANAKLEAQQTLLGQLHDKLVEAVTANGFTEQTTKIQQKILDAESALMKLIEQYKKVAAAAKTAGEQMKKASESPLPGANQSITAARSQAAPSSRDTSITLGKLDAVKDAQAAGKLSGEYEKLEKKTGQVKKSMDGKNKTLQRQTKDTNRESRAVNVLAAAFASVKTATEKAKKALSGFGDVLKKLLLAAGIYKAATAIGRFIFDGIKSAINVPEIENMFRVSLGNMAVEADRFAKQFKQSLGVDEYATKQMIGTFNNMIATMGIGSQTAYNMSKSLTILANDMASFYNVPTEQAYENLQSAMSGQSEAVRKYGYILNETTIKEVALRHGIIQQGQTLNENQKVLARYLALMEQSRNAQGDMSRTIGSLQNQLRILQGNINAAGRAIGEAFIPFLEAVVPWLNAFAIVLQRVGVALARFTYSLFGRNYDAEKKKQQDALQSAGNIAGGLEDVADAEKEVGKEADKTKKKVQNMLAPFDELYVIQQKIDSDKKPEVPENPNTPGLEWDVPTLEVPEGDSPLEQMADRIIAKLREIFKVFRQAWKSEGQKTIDAIKYGLGSVLDALKAIGQSFSEVWNNGTGLAFLENVLRIVQLIFNILGDIASAFTRAWKEAKAGTALIQQIFDALNAVMELVLSVGDAFRKAWNDNRGVEIWSAILSVITNVFAIVENLADRLKEAWEANDNGVKIWGHILDIVRDLLEFLDRISDATAAWVAQLDFKPLVGSFENLLGVIEQLVDSILNGLGWAYENVLLPFGKWLIQTAAPAFLDAVAAILASKVWKDAAKSIKNLYENGLKPLAKWAAEKLMEFLEWIEKNGDAAAKVVLEIGKAFLVWKSIKFANAIATDFLSMVKAIKNSGLVKILSGFGGAFKTMAGMASDQAEKISSSYKGMAGNIRASLSGLVGTISSKLKSVASAIAAFAASNPFAAVAIAVGAVATAIGVTLYGEYKKTIDMMEARNMAKAFEGVPVSMDAVKASMEGIVQKYAELEQKAQEHRTSMQSLCSEYSTTMASIQSGFDALKSGTADVGTTMEGLSANIMGLSSTLKSQVDTDGAYFYDTWKGIFDNTSALTEERESEILQSIVSSNETRKSEIDRIEGEILSLQEQYTAATINGETEKSALIFEEVKRRYAELAKIAEQEQARQAEIDKQRQMLLAREILEGRQIVTKENYQEMLAQIDQDEKTARDSAISCQAEVRGTTAANHKIKMDEMREEKKSQAEIDAEVSRYNDELKALNENYAQSLQEIGTQSVTSKTLLQQAFNETSQGAKNVQDEFLNIQTRISELNSYIEGQNRLFGTEFFDIDGINKAQTEIETLGTKLQTLVDTNPEMFAKKWDDQFEFTATEAADSTREIQGAIQTSIEESARYASTQGGTVNQNLLTSLSQGVASNLEEYKKALEPAGKMLPEGLAKGATDNNKVATDAMSAAAQDVTKAAETTLKINSPSRVFITIGKFIMEGLAKGITDNVQLVTKALTAVVETIKKAMQQALTGVSEDSNTQVQKMASNLSDAKGGSGPFYEFGRQTMQSLAQGIADNAQLVLNALTQTVESITFSFKEQLQIEEYSMVFFGFGLSMVQGISEGIRQNFQLIQGTIQELAQIISTALVETFTMMEEGAGESQGAGVGGQQTGGGMFYQFGVKLITGLSQGITDAMPIVLESITAASVQIVDAFKTAFVIDEISQVFYDFGALFMQSIADAMLKNTELVQQQIEALKELIVTLYTEFMEAFSEILDKDLTSINEIVEKQMDDMVSIVSTAVDDAAREIASLISKVNSAIAKVRELQSAASGARSYSYSGGYSTRSVSRELPRFASGAVLRTPTVGLMAEYPGASSNPEIVTPQNILHETMVDAMFPAVAALSQKLDALIEAVHESGVEIKGDAAEFLQVIKKADEERSIMSGQSLFAPY